MRNATKLTGTNDKEMYKMGLINLKYFSKRLSSSMENESVLSNDGMTDEPSISQSLTI
jgi:hypothetical protein